MEGYTDFCIYLDIREMYRKFRQWERIILTASMLEELKHAGSNLAILCLRERYDLIVDLSGKYDQNVNKVINALSLLGYQTTRVLIDSAGNPYIDVDPDDFGDLLPPHRWDQIHTEWIEQAVFTILSGKIGIFPTDNSP